MLQGARGNRTFAAACCCSLPTFGLLEFILTHPPTANRHKRRQRRHTATVHGKLNLKEAENRLIKAAQICSRQHVRICLEAVHFTWRDEKTFICRALLNTENNPEDFRAKIEGLRFKMRVGRRIPRDCEVPNSDWMNDVWRKSLRMNFFLFLSLSLLGFQMKFWNATKTQHNLYRWNFVWPARNVRTRPPVECLSGSWKMLSNKMINWKHHKIMCLTHSR